MGVQGRRPSSSLMYWRSECCQYLVHIRNSHDDGDAHARSSSSRPSRTVQYIRTLHAHIESLERGAPSRSALGADPLTDPSSPPLSSSVHSPSSLSSSSRQSTPNVTTRAASSSNLGPVRESLDVSIVPSATVDAATMLLSLASPELRGVVGGGAALEIQEWRL